MPTLLTTTTTVKGAYIGAAHSQIIDKYLFLLNLNDELKYQL